LSHAIPDLGGWPGKKESKKEKEGKNSNREKERLKGKERKKEEFSHAQRNHFNMPFPTPS